ncbi:MAG: alpha/beta fold hydrolase [Myxococcales bacterium]
MAFLTWMLATMLAIQAGAVLARLPGLHLFPRASPRALALLPALLAVGTAIQGWKIGSAPTALAGVLFGLLAALLVPALRPLDPDRELLAKATSLEIAGHADAGTHVLRPAGCSRAVVLVCHGGGNDRTFALWQAVPRLLERGFTVVLFHMAGHGRGGSDLLDVASFRARLDAVREATAREIGGPIVALGQSMGGAAVLDAIARGVPLDGAVTVSAISKLELGWRVLRELAMVLHRPAWNAARHSSVLRLLPLPFSGNRRRFPVRVEGGGGHLPVFETMLRELDLERRLAETQVGYPVLLVHGTEDAIVPVEQGRALARALGAQAQYLELPGRHHLDPLFDDGLIDRIGDFVDGCAARLLRAPAKP